MRYIASAILGLAAVAAAQDCVSSYDACRSSGETEGTCTNNLAVCKDQCSDANSKCNQSGGSDCIGSYNSCLDSFAVQTTPSCVNSYSSCLSSETEPTCNSLNTICKNSCSVALDACQSSGDASVTAACRGQYNTCLDNFAELAQPDCVSKYDSCLSTTDEATCNSLNTQCKDTASTIYSTCLVSGDADEAKVRECE